MERRLLLVFALTFLVILVFQPLQRLALDQSGIDQRLWRNGTGHRHITQAFQVDNRVLLTKYVGKAMLRHSTDQGHLAAFKSARLPAPTTGSG